ncbi:cupin domain-containing protein [Streptomyces rubellomurinus]|uniref:Cupin n=1 Tax=Streptomyces rubellomurinus (strain ATCC 31215) TaxID=359131 RepID=A0A0F2TKT0_STRR3|nr:cupin domain-containing protein [Streptomyces rubellomurinus]KJS63749.1 cupin [Streptomyces rubellomurinus]
MTTKPNSATPILARRTEAETCADPSATMTLLAEPSPAEGGFTVYRSVFTEGAAGAPAHFHTRAWELFFVISGSLRVLIGEQVTVLDAGDFLAVPPHTPHAFAAAPGGGADVLFLFTPGTDRHPDPKHPGMDRFDYLRLLGSVMRGETSPTAIATSADRFDNHYVDSPAWRTAFADRS